MRICIFSPFVFNNILGASFIFNIFLHGIQKRPRARRFSSDFTSPHVPCFKRQPGDVKSPLHFSPEPVRQPSARVAPK